MKKIYVYRRGKVVEKGSSEDWEEDILIRLKREYKEHKKLSRRSPKEEGEIEEARIDYFGRHVRQQENLETIRAVCRFLRGY